MPRDITVTERGIFRDGLCLLRGTPVLRISVDSFGSVVVYCLVRDNITSSAVYDHVG